MALQTTSNAPALTEAVFLADRQRIWSSFTGFTTGGAIAIVILLVLMAVFLL